MKKLFTTPLLILFICLNYFTLSNKAYSLSATGFDDNFPGGTIECGSFSLNNSKATVFNGCLVIDGSNCPPNGQTNYYQDCSYTTNSDGSLCTTNSCTCWGSNEKTIYGQFCPKVDGEYDFNVTNISCSGGTSILQFQIMSGTSPNNSLCELTSIYCNSGTTSNTDFSLNLTGGKCYTILFDSGAGAICSWDLNISCCTPTSIPTPTVPNLSDVVSICKINTLPAPTATTDCGETIIGTTSDLPINTIGTTSITWTYEDNAGNITTQNQSVTILEDNIVPSPNISNLNEIVEMCEVSNLVRPSATDNCDGQILGVHNASLPINTIGSTIITWTYTDNAGNITTQNQNIIIQENCPLNTVINYENSISVFPIPAKNILNIQLSNGYKMPSKVKIIDVFGKEMISITPNNFSFSINTQHLSSGLYLIYIEETNKPHIKMFYKE